MKIYSMNAKDRIEVINSSVRQERKEGQFASEKEWAGMAAGFPMTRLVRVWNQLPGVTRVERFTSRAKAIERIWKIMRDLEPEPEPEPVRVASQQNGETKKEQVLALLKQDEGVSLEQMIAATGWQKHSVRGFLSGTVRRKMGLKIVSSNNTQGTRIYRVEA